MASKKDATFGTGGRSSFFYMAIVKDFSSTSSLVGSYDTNLRDMRTQEITVEMDD